MKTKISTLFSTRVVGLIASTLLCGIPGVLPAQESPAPTTPEVEEAAEPSADKAAAKLSAKFTGFAGSEENAEALVTGLHGGTAVTLTTTVDGQPVTTEFQPATGEMGLGNAALSLALARESLDKIGITEPTPDQIVAALNGGSVTGSDGTATTLAGVLTLRAAGQGWGDIAKTLGVKVGPLMRQFHAGNHRMERPDRPVDAVSTTRGIRGAESAPRPSVAHRPVWAGANRPVPIPHPVRPGKP